jgi:RNA polymerase sigma-70 factor, ECF subfamily
MPQTNDLLRFATTPSRDHYEFEQLTDPYRRELLVHCYRILGSLDDAEDALQETLLRAWRRLDTLKVSASLRAWLYKIGTNVSLDMLDSRKVRMLPNTGFAPANPHDPLPAPTNDPIWLEPFPDEYLVGHTLNPEARYEARESVTLAFLTALQALPGRQRAVLLLRDVLDWKAQEVAELLDLSVAAVNSALQRARTTMKKQQKVTVPPPEKQRLDSLLARYVEAWETADSAGLIALLRDDAVLTMPPIPTWFRGRLDIKAFLDGFVFAGRPRNLFRLVPTQANGSPAFAVYQQDDAGQYRPAAIQVLTIGSDAITQIDDFLTFDNRVFERFNLPIIG